MPSSAINNLASFIKSDQCKAEETSNCRNLYFTAQFQPVASDDVAVFVAKYALAAPVNGKVEILYCFLNC